MKRVAIVQSSYIPWKGYFDLIRAVDEFILLEDVQYTKRDWRNRNRIKTPSGTQWLTVPVNVKGRSRQTIKEVTVSDRHWADRHWSVLRHNYARAPHFAELAPSLEALYRDLGEEIFLSRINRRCIEVICDLLHIPTRISWAMDYGACQGRTERLVQLCRCAGAAYYLSGPSARAYIEPGIFAEAGITLQYANYEGYAAYPQLWGDFEHHVTVLDLLFNVGPDARYLRDLA